MWHFVGIQKISDFRTGMLSHASERQAIFQGNGRILRVIPGQWALQRFVNRRILRVIPGQWALQRSVNRRILRGDSWSVGTTEI